MLPTTRTSSRTRSLLCAAGCLLLIGISAGARGGTEASDPAQVLPSDTGPAIDAAFDAPGRAVSLDEARLELAAAEREHGSDSLQLVEPLLDLATAKARAGDFAAAAADFAEAVRLVETLRGAMDQHLLEPLRGLGLSANAAGEYVRGAEALERAMHIMRIHHGLYHLDQRELLDALSRSYVGLGRGEEAEFSQRAALQLAEREYGADSSRIVPAVSALAGWYHGQGRFLEERALLERKMDLLKAARGENDASLVGPLRALALSYRLGYIPSPEGERALKRALEIHASNPQTTRGHAETLVALGDWYLVFRERMRAFDTYAQAYALLADDAASAGLMDELFGSPVPLFYLKPRPPEIEASAADEDVAQGFVLVEYAVSPIGRVVDIQLIDSDPPGIMDHRVIQALRGARYRPRIADGEPVHTAGLRLRNTFAFNQRSAEEESRPPDP